MKSGLAISAVAVAVTGAACATIEPIAYLNGFRWSRVELNTFDTRIVSVDGVTRLQNEKPHVKPGVRTIVLEAPPAAGFRRGKERTIVLIVEPCMQYWLEARRTNPLSQDFEPRVNHSERIRGCKPNEH